MRTILEYLISPHCSFEVLHLRKYAEQAFEQLNAIEKIVEDPEALDLIKELMATMHALGSAMTEHEKDIEYSQRDLELDESTDNAIREHMAKLANLRHAENNSLKEEALAWYEKNRDRFTSKDAAAIEITTIVPVKFKTARNWLKGL
ncbi:MAG: hypothetical protein WCP34_11835 [Pseudomonadota bacterium]